MNFQVKRQSGLTLVELMIATTLSLVLLAGVLLVFSANKTTYRMQNRPRHPAGERSLRHGPDHGGSADGRLRWLPVTPYRASYRCAGQQ